jgi:hypothetical protein
MPKALSGAEIHFMFKSPLHDAIEAQLGQKFLEGKALVADAAADVWREVVGHSCGAVRRELAERT